MTFSRGGFGRHEYGQPIRIKWLAYEKASAISEKRLWTPLSEIILDTDHSGQ